MTAAPSIVPLELTGIAKRFGRLAVLRGVDLTVEPGEVVGLVGANGAGKTTLLSIIAGLMQPSDGERRFGAKAVPEVGANVRARLALVTHTAQLYPRLTAAENLELFAELREAVAADFAAGGPLLERLGLADASDRLVGTFSRGMMQRLALARALLGRPELLLLDEPFTALDRPGRELLASVIVEERARGTALLISSHDFDAIAAITDRTVLLEGGVIADEVRRKDTENASYRADVGRLAGRLQGLEEARESHG